MPRKKGKKYTVEELWNPQPDLSTDAAAYARQSTKEQFVENVESHISQTVGLLNEAKRIGFKDDGSTGIVILFVENQVVSEDGTTQIKNASGTWPIDKRPDLRTILDLIEEDRIKLVIVEFVDRLFRDEDRIDSNIFIKTCKEHDCFVYITSKRMVYNFANPLMADMFRQEVAFAAAYIQHHVKDVMIRRRDQAVERGQYGGGYIPTGFIICREEGNKYYKHLIPYQPHADILNDVAVKVSIEAELSKMNIMAIHPSVRQPILEFLVIRILLDRVSTRFYRIQVEWKVPEWDTSIIHLDRKEFTCTAWSEEEITILADTYPRCTHEKVLQALPQRSWRSITDRASRLNIKRKYFRWTLPIDMNMSWSDWMFIMTNKNIEIGKWANTP